MLGHVEDNLKISAIRQRSELKKYVVCIIQSIKYLANLALQICLVLFKSESSIIIFFLGKIIMCRLII